MHFNLPGGIGRASRWLAFAVCWRLALLGLLSAPLEISREEGQPWRILSFTKDAQVSGKNVFYIDFQRGRDRSQLEKVWLATSAGLLEYDGYSWRQHGVAQGLPSDFVRCVLVTRAGDLWVGTDRGAGIYDGTTFRLLGTRTNLAGPSVRRMVEDADGTLWFCSDPWPSSARSGGLTSYRNGQWRAYTTQDGLPSEYVVNYHRDSGGHPWVVTKEGLATWSGDRWVNALKPGAGRDPFSAGSFAEIPGRPLMFSAGVEVYLLRDTVWTLQPLAPSFPYHQHGICASSDGKILACRSTDQEVKVIAEWTEQGWVNLSAPFNLPRGYNEDIREDPNGNIWVVGFETVVCWRRNSQWELLPNMPPPKFAGPSNRIWFGKDGTGVVPAPPPIFFERDQWHRVDRSSEHLASDGNGGAWGWLSNQVTHWLGTNGTHFGESETGLKIIHAGSAVPGGGYWLVGLNRDGQLASARFGDGRWSHIDVPEAQGTVSKLGMVATRDKLWFLARPAQRTNAVLCEIGSKPSIVFDVPADILSEFHYGLHVSPGGSNFWIYGENGLYRRDLGWSEWLPITNLPSRAVMGVVERKDEVWVGCSGTTGGSVGLARYRAGNWTSFPIQSIHNISVAPDQTVLVGGTDLLTVVENRPDAIPVEIELPEHLRADGVLKELAGNFWIGNGARLLRFSPDRVSPETRLAAGVTNVLNGTRLTLGLEAVERFRPFGKRDDFCFSWQLDDGGWSPFQQYPERQIFLTNLTLGNHRLAVRARDVGGDIDMSPAFFDFTVHPLPLQNRPWFLGAVGVVILSLGALAFVAIRARTELAGYARALEDRVAERTSALEADLVERRRAEAALRESEARWHFAIEGSGDGLWDWNPQTGQVHFSTRWKTMLGFEDHEISDRDQEWESRVHPDDKPSVMDQVQAHLNGTTAFYVSEHRLRCKDGSYKWILARGKVLNRSAEGLPIRVIGTHSDISERKRVESALLESEQRLKATLESLLEGCQIIGFDWTYLYVNRVAAQQNRRTCESMIGRKVSEIHPRVEQSPLFNMLKQCLTERIPQRMENVFDYEDGTFAILDLEIRPVADGVFVHSIDVTARRRAEQERERLVLLVEHSADFIATASLDGQLTYLNPAGRRMIGFSETGDIRKLNFGDYVPERWRKWFLETVVPVVIENGIWDGEMQLFHLQTKRLIDISRSMFLVRNRDTGEPMGFATVTRDVTARKAAEKALRESEERFAKAFRANPAIIAISTYAEGKYVDVNEAFIQLLGFTREEVLGRTALELGVWAIPSQRQAILRAIEQRQLVRSIECQLRSKAGNTLTVLASVERIELDGEPCLLFLNYDITERKEAEKVAQETRVRFQQLAENVREVFWLTNVEKTQILYISPAYERIWGRTCDSLYRAPGSWIESIHVEDRKRVSISLPTQTFEDTYDVEYRVLRPDGSVRWIHDRAFPVRDAAGKVYRIAGIAEDITERRQLEAQFRQAQKMDALGTLSGGIAHDFNNILGAVFGNIHLASLELAPSHPATPLLDEIQKAAIRARDLVRQILAFSRQQPKSRQVLRLEPVVHEAAGLLRASLPAGIELVKVLDPNTPGVFADATQIHQILLNLCTNAWHAMGDSRGRIEIGLKPVEVKPEDAAAAPDLRPGLYACLSVTDNGQGMDAATLERIFEPFFTTKEPGRGTGLGLSVVHGIVQSHDGVIRVTSQPGQGTAFQLFFPAAQAEAASTQTPARSLPKGAGERILYLDDEKPLVDVAIRTMKWLGYTADGYTRPEAALKAFRENPGHYQVLITDLHMPEFSGVDFIQEIRNMDPAVPILLSSGHITDDVLARIRNLGVNRVLHKPNTIDDLSQSLHELLQKGKS